MMDTLNLQSRHFRPKRNELKEAVRLMGFRARWNDGGEGEGTPLPEGMTHEGIENVEALSEAYKSSKAKGVTAHIGGIV